MLCGKLFRPWGGAGDVGVPLWFLCFLLNKSSGNPYQKVLDFSQLFVADAPIK